MNDKPIATKKTPWDFIGEEETRLLGDVITKHEEQVRWCKAMVFGTLPFHAFFGIALMSMNTVLGGWFEDNAHDDALSARDTVTHALGVTRKLEFPEVARARAS